MSQQRTINDQIWRSDRLSGCTVEDRYALLYFLSSPFRLSCVLAESAELSAGPFVDVQRALKEGFSLLPPLH